MQRKAISLISGGLDSTLSTIMVARQGVQVTAVKFLTNFGCDAGEGSSCGHDATSLAERFGFELKLCHLGDQYIEMVKNPPHGRGKNMNPCIDCRIMMLQWAREFMKESGAGFLITGEVLDQRPMSQHLAAFEEIERVTGLEGLILRPLSAKLLPPTIPEKLGIVDREQLGDICGRSRKRQYELAASYGITPEEYGQPAGGCLLTDPGYSRRLRDLWDHDPSAGANDINLLQVGRHFRANRQCKIIVGRNQLENEMIAVSARPGDVLMRTKVPGPTTLIRGPHDQSILDVAAALTSKYSDGDGDVEVMVEPVGGQPYLVVVPSERIPESTQLVSHIV